MAARGKNSRSALLGPALAGLLLSGCASSSGPGPDFSLPDMPKMPDLSTVASIPKVEAPPEGNATELYARVARGALGCWFAANGPLKKGYIYHADADAPSRGGKAEITVHERNSAQPNPRGAKAFKVRIDPKDEASAAIQSENVKMPEPAATAMKDDVERWSRGETGCKGPSTAALWAPEDIAAAAAAAEAQAAAAAKSAALSEKKKKKKLAETPAKTAKAAPAAAKP